MINVFRASLDYVKEVIRIEDVADQDAVIDYVKKDIDFRGAKAWILVFAILVASLGLNVNSTAVIIGAMLISPLMGPIIGIGVGIGISDRKLLSRSAKNILTAVVISMVTSATYFLISPFDDAASELLSRTHPTLLDALIAVAGGAAGAIAIVRRDRSNVVPGVAIATALMPPLCTAGWALSNLDMNAFFGAFYLFFINSVYISAATYVMVRILKFKQVQEANPVTAAKARRIVLVVIVLTMIPSIYTGWNMLRRNVFQRRVLELVRQSENLFPRTSFVVSRANWGSDTSRVTFTLVGPALKESELATVHSRALAIGLDNTLLDLRQASGVSDVMMSNATEQMRQSVIGDLYDRNIQEMYRKDSIIQVLRSTQDAKRATVDLLKDVAREVEQIDRNVTSITYQDSLVIHGKQGAADTVSVAFVAFEKRPKKDEMENLQNWLRVRLKRDSIIVQRVMP